MSDLPKITIAPNGPYVVSGGVPLVEETIGIDDAGNAWSWEQGKSVEGGERFALCRCGQSANKPFCDGTHARVGFDGTEVASRRPFGEDATRIEGPTMDLLDNQPLCAFARFCDGYGRIWNGVTQTDGTMAREVVAHQATRCPSGRLVIEDKDDGGRPVEPAAAPSIGLVQDPQQEAAGPLWVRGGIEIVSSDGTSYERRERVTLCRCGQSSNKPFCDGTHAHVGFQA